MTVCGHLSALKAGHARGGHRICGPARTAESGAGGTPPKDALELRNRSAGSGQRPREISTCQASGLDLGEEGGALATALAIRAYIYTQVCTHTHGHTCCAPPAQIRTPQQALLLPSRRGRAQGEPSRSGLLPPEGRHGLPILVSSYPLPFTRSSSKVHSVHPTNSWSPTMCQVPGKVPKSEKEERREGGRRKGKKQRVHSSVFTRKSMYLVRVCMCVCTYTQSHILACVRELLLEMKCPQHRPQGKSTAMQRKAFSDHPDFQKKLG